MLSLGPPTVRSITSRAGARPRLRTPAAGHGRPSTDGGPALLEIWSFPLAAIALVLIFPSPLELRGAFAVLLAAGTALVSACLCLLRSLQEKDYYARSLETRT